LQNVVTLSDYQQVDLGLKYGFLMEDLRLLARCSVVIDKENVVQHIQWVVFPVKKSDISYFFL